MGGKHDFPWGQPQSPHYPQDTASQIPEPPFGPGTRTASFYGPPAILPDLGFYITGWRCLDLTGNTFVTAKWHVCENTSDVRYRNDWENYHDISNNGPVIPTSPGMICATPTIPHSRCSYWHPGASYFPSPAQQLAYSPPADPNLYQGEANPLSLAKVPNHKMNC
jgi:hypothetical protein